MNTLTFGTFSGEVIGSFFCLKFCLMFKQCTMAGVRLYDTLGDCLKGYSRGQHLCKFIGTKGKRLHKKRVLTPTGLVWTTNMAAVSLFRDTNIRMYSVAKLFSFPVPVYFYFRFLSN